MKGKLIVFEGGEGSGKSTMVNKTYNYFAKKYQPDSLYLTPHDRQLFELLKHNKKIGLFCINDGENISNEERIFAKNFLQEMFPQKSSFEK